MALIHDIRSELIDIRSELFDEEKGVGSLLLKLKALASELKADVLEDWVTHEIQGYPKGVPVPDYRKTQIIFLSDNNAPVSRVLIEQYAGAEWLEQNIRISLREIDWMMKNKDNKYFNIATGDLNFLLQSKGIDFGEIRGIFNASDYIKIQEIVRDKALDLVSKIGKEIPRDVNIDIDDKDAEVSPTKSETASNIDKQIIYTNSVNNFNTTGDGNVVQVGDSFVHALIKKGIDKKDAEELEKIAQKNPETPDKKIIANWVEKIFEQGNKWVRGVGKEVATATIIEMIKKFLL